MQENKTPLGEESANWLMTHTTLPTSALPRVQRTQTERLAWGLSALFHPLLLPTYLFALLFWISPAMMGVSNEAIRLRMLMMLFAATFVIPMISIYMLYRLGSIHSLEMHDRQDRIFPLVSTTLFYGLTTYLFIKQLSVLYLVTVMLGATTFCLAVVTVVSIFWKISVHSVGICGAMGFLLALYYKNGSTDLLYPMLGVIIVAGLLMSARLHLHAHTPRQVFWGACLGLSVSMTAVWIFG